MINAAPGLDLMVLLSTSTERHWMVDCERVDVSGAGPGRQHVWARVRCITSTQAKTWVAYASGDGTGFPPPPHVTAFILLRLWSPEGYWELLDFQVEDRCLVRLATVADGDCSATVDLSVTAGSVRFTKWAPPRRIP